MFNEHIVDYLKQTSADEESYGCLWDLVSENDKKRFDNIITQTPERSLKENWEGIKWKLIVYQKHSFYNGGGHKK